MKSYRHASLFEVPTGALPSSPMRTVASLPWMAITDSLGLVVALTVVSARLGLATTDGRATVVMLAGVAALVWLLFGQARSLDTVIKGWRPAVVAVPTITALVVASMQILAAGRAPLLELLLFALTWTLALAISRMTYPLYRVPRNILVIGAPSFTRELANVSGYRVVRLDCPPKDFEGFDFVATDPTETYDESWLRWMSHANMYGVKVLPAPLVVETLTGRVPYEMLDGRWAFEVLNGRSPYRFWKRAFDVAAVIVGSPFILLMTGIVGLIVLFDSGRPTLFWQERLGLGGKPFRMVKFRTMSHDAEANGSAFATIGDLRITRIGRFLRQYRLDEIPQFWNVLRGEMSIIGPRPEQLSFAAMFDAEIPLYGHRYSVLPGITGWAQVNDGYAATVDETKSKLRHDFYYVKHLSLHLDMLIVWRTFLTILTGFGSR